MEVTAIFDIGKTNKKFILFDNDGNIVHEYSETLAEAADDDGFPCEDLQLLNKWILDKWTGISSQNRFQISSVNFTSYGASLVHIDKNDRPATPLYSYLKPYPAELTYKLYERFEGKWNFSAVTRTPPMGMLNSGLQLLWIKHRKPQIFQKIAVSLHLPQYLSFLFSKQKVSEYTSIGCHTALWDFSRNHYHQWVSDNGIDKLLAPILPSSIFLVTLQNKDIAVGTGIHDSSSALIPYIRRVKEPFLLISSGTWCITLNPFNATPLTREELSLDCLCYMAPDGKPVKASRILLGKEHEFQTARIENHFERNKGYCKTIQYDQDKITALLGEHDNDKILIPACMEGSGPFPGKSSEEWKLKQFSSPEEAYYHLMIDLTCMLKYSVQLVDSLESNEVNNRTIFVEGGFGFNCIFMNLLSNHFPGRTVKASFLKHATALGAVLQVKKSFELGNWDFQSYRSSPVSVLLESYYNRFWKHA